MSSVKAPTYFEGYTMISDGGGKTWKTLYSVLRHGAKTLDCYKEPQQLKLKESVFIAGAMLYTFPPDSVAMFKNANLFGIIHITKRQDDQIWVVNCSTASDRDKFIDGLGKLGATNCGEKPYIPIVPDSLFEGKLDKFGGTVKTRKSRYFVLQPHQLAYYSKRTDKTPKGAIKLSGMSSAFIAGDSGPNGGPATSAAVTGNGAAGATESDTLFGFTVISEAGGRPYKMVAGDNTERDKWLEAIKKAIGGREKSATVSGISAKLSLLSAMPTTVIAPSTFGAASGTAPPINRTSSASISVARPSAGTIVGGTGPVRPAAGTVTGETWDADLRRAPSVADVEEPPIFDVIRMVTGDEPYDDLELEHLCHAIGLIGVEDILGLADFNLDEIGMPHALKQKFKKYLITHLGPNVQVIENKPSVNATVASVAAKKEAAAAAAAGTSTGSTPAATTTTAPAKAAPPIPPRPSISMASAPTPTATPAPAHAPKPEHSTPATTVSGTKPVSSSGGSGDLKDVKTGTPSDGDTGSAENSGKFSQKQKIAIMAGDDSSDTDPDDPNSGHHHKATNKSTAPPSAAAPAGSAAAGDAKSKPPTASAAASDEKSSPVKSADADEDDVVPAAPPRDDHPVGSGASDDGGGVAVSMAGADDDEDENFQPPEPPPQPK